MKPKPCPYPLIRIGGHQDGAYLIPDDLDGIKACFSPGVNNVKPFEDELSTRHGIACHLCDYTSDLEALETPLIESMQTFLKKWLDTDHGQDSITLDEWVEDKSPASEDDLLLQMDIEGAEYRNLLTCKESTLNRFRIIVVELHDLDSANDPQEFEKELGPFLRRINKSHICVHAHPNNCCGEVTILGTDLVVPRVIELTLLRRDRLEHGKPGRSFYPLLPHPLDLDSNVSELPPQLLEGDWIDEKSLESESPAGISTWKKAGLLSMRLNHAILRLQELDHETQQLKQKHQKAIQRIEYLEKRIGELERPINLYLKIKQLLKSAKQSQ